MKTLYWIADLSGVKSLVEGADERDRWTKVNGWREAVEPLPGDLVWLQHEVTSGRQKFAAEAVSQWEGLGWKPCAPPEPADFTKDPQFVDQADATVEDEPVAEPAKTPSKRAASGTDKE